MTELERLCAALDTLGWSDRELARRLDVNDVTIRRVIAGKRPTHPNLVAWLELWADTVSKLPPYPAGWKPQHGDKSDI